MAAGMRYVLLQAFQQGLVRVFTDCTIDVPNDPSLVDNTVDVPAPVKQLVTAKRVVLS
jgi:hypothetical protein